MSADRPSSIRMVVTMPDGRLAEQTWWCYEWTPTEEVEEVLRLFDAMAAGARDAGFPTEVIVERTTTEVRR